MICCRGVDCRRCRCPRPQTSLTRITRYEAKQGLSAPACASNCKNQRRSASHPFGALRPNVCLRPIPDISRAGNDAEMTTLLVLVVVALFPSAALAALPQANEALAPSAQVDKPLTPSKLLLELQQSSYRLARIASAGEYS